MAARPLAALREFDRRDSAPTRTARPSADPPASLAASIAWDSGDGFVTLLNVWDAPGAVSDFYMERVLPLVQAEGEPEHKPRRHGQPVAVYLRS